MSSDNIKPVVPIEKKAPVVKKAPVAKSNCIVRGKWYKKGDTLPV